MVTGRDQEERRGAARYHVAASAGLLPMFFVFLATNAVVLHRTVRSGVAYHDQHRILQIVVLLILATVGIVDRHRVVTAWRMLPRTGRLLLPVVPAAGLLSAMGARFPRAALREVGLFGLLFLVTLVVAAARRQSGPVFDRTAIRLVGLTAIAYAAAFMALDGIARMGLGGVRGGEMWGFSNPRFFGQVALWILPLLVTGATTARETTRTRLILGATACLWGALVLESGSRTAVGAIAVGVVAVLATQFRRAWRWLIAAAAVSAGSYLGWATIFNMDRGSTASGSALTRIGEEGAHGSGRAIFWTDAIEITKDHPVLGIGPEHYAHIEGTLFAHPHNAPLQLMAEWGLPAAIILLTIACWAVGRWTVGVLKGHYADISEPVALAGLTAALTAGASASLLDGIIVMPITQTLLATVCGWMLGIHQEARCDGVTQPKSTAPLVVAVVAACSMILAGAFPYAARPARELAEYRQQHPDQVVSPRFWMVGRLTPTDWSRLAF